MYTLTSVSTALTKVSNSRSRTVHLKKKKLRQKIFTVTGNVNKLTAITYPQNDPIGQYCCLSLHLIGQQSSEGLSYSLSFDWPKTYDRLSSHWSILGRIPEALQTVIGSFADVTTRNKLA